jgi:UPF0755 protein
LAATFAVGASGTIYFQLTRPGPSVNSIAVVVPPGSTVRGISALLVEQGVLNDGAPFSIGVRVFAGNRPLQAGEFDIPAGLNALSIIDLLQTGGALAHPLTITEGLTNHQIFILLEGTEGLEGTPTPIADEGTLLPETYHFTRGDTVDDIVDRMQLAMSEVLTELWPDRDSGLPINTPEEAVVLASIVERETGLPEERPMVAGVFINRLKIGMPLQADPTVAFAVAGSAGLDRTLTLKDLEFDSPYNTYVYRGLPPGPIANPGRASIEAVLHPAATSSLYFVADGSGGHAFADTLDEHNDNVANYRALQR